MSFKFTPANKPKSFYRDLWRKENKGSDKLFDACWRRLIGDYYNVSYSGNTTQSVLDLLDYYAAEKVNNSRSIFYITG